MFDINYCIETQVFPDPMLNWIPHLQRFTLVEDYSFTFGGLSITIPAGTTTDLASVPRLVLPFVTQLDLGLVAPLLHDELYKWAGDLPQVIINKDKHVERIWTRKECDLLLLKLCEIERTSRAKCLAVYYGVRLLGWPFWEWRRRHRNKYLLGLSYVLKLKYK